MYLRILLLSFFIIVQATGFAQVNPKNITIVRDSFGVPHIHGKTDAEAAYGLAWAHSEDNFKDIQENLLVSKGMLGEVIGKEGVLFDFALRFFSIDTLVDYHYEKQISPDYKLVLEAYIQAINDYAKAHPKEVLLKKALPFEAKDILKSSTLSLTLFAGGGMALKAIKENRIEFFFQPNEIGSNSLAIAPNRTEDGKTWLLLNSHQPLEGRFAWYEAHVKSDEGWDIIGSLFPGGTTIFTGSTPTFGWAHTTNYHTFGDIYKLTHKGNKYLYDNEWKTFTSRKAKLKIKLGGIKLGLTKKILSCEYGPVFKTKHGWYAVKFPGAMDIRSNEQWYRMNKAKNLKEFEQALRMEAIPLFNIMYGDVEGNIFYQSGCQIPLRDPALNWKQPINGVSSKYNWKKLVPYERKPTLLNPSCGYLFSCNQSQYLATGKGCEWKGDFVGIQRFNYNRGERYAELTDSIKGKFTWQDFMRIKFDKSYSRNASYAKNFKALYELNEAMYPKLADVIGKVKKWNWSGDITNREAPVVFLTQEILMKKWKAPFAFLMIKDKPLEEAQCAWALAKAKKAMLKNYGTTDVALGDMQRLVRGSINLPTSGMREVSRAADSKLIKKSKGIYALKGGDGYMQLNRYGKDGAEILSVSPYGASSHPSSKHYTDQMELFANEQFKPMTFDWKAIQQNAERIYHPGE
jgi:acyl-homoserine-lactone acylase